MRIGFTLPQFGGLASQPGSVTTFAREAEALGADSLWAGDRLLSPVDPVIGYGGGPDMPDEFRTVLDPFAVLTAAAAVTSRALLGTSVLNAPFYPPALLGRSLTSIDMISGGRLIAGLGSGWSPDEFQAVGVPMKQRGARLDECLDVLETMWTENPAEHHGKHWDIPASYIDLKPVQRPRPPVYLGGRTPVALRRVAGRADGWLPSTLVPGRFDHAGIADTLAGIRAEAAKFGRDPDKIDAVLRLNATAAATVADIAAAIAMARDIGIGHVIVELMYLTGDLSAALDITAQVLAARDAS
jgi:probable F420-dependent oxidoreductase